MDDLTTFNRFLIWRIVAFIFQSNVANIVASWEGPKVREPANTLVTLLAPKLRLRASEA
jgi:hypothetical protein